MSTRVQRLPDLEREWVRRRSRTGAARGGR
ncbi:MAG: hypothetical protein ACYC6H_11650 [Bellilinea sp.]